MKARDLCLGILVTIIWGSNFSAIEIGLENLNPFLLNALRFTFSAFPLIFFIKKPQNIPTATLILYGMIFGTGLWWVVNIAMKLGASPGISSIVLQFSAFFTILWSALFFKEKIYLPHILGIILSLIGLLVILKSTHSSSAITGIILEIIAAFSWSVCNMIVKQSKPSDMLAFIVWSSLFACIPLYILTYLFEGSQAFSGLIHHLNTPVIFSILFQSYITTVFGYKVWNNLMKKYPAYKVAPLSLLVPVSGITTSHFMFNESITINKLIAILLILIGIAVFLKADKLRKITGFPSKKPSNSP